MHLWSQQNNDSRDSHGSAVSAGTMHKQINETILFNGKLKSKFFNNCKHWKQTNMFHEMEKIDFTVLRKPNLMNTWWIYNLFPTS